MGLEDIRGIKERFPGLAGIMLGRGLLASPWLATEFVSGQVLTVNERRDKLVMFHESLMMNMLPGWKVASIRYYLK